MLAAAADAEPYTSAFNCPNEKGVLWRDLRGFLGVRIIWETLLKAHPKWVFPAASKYRRDFYLTVFFLEGACSVFCKIAVEPYSGEVLMISGDFLKR